MKQGLHRQSKVYRQQNPKEESQGSYCLLMKPATFHLLFEDKRGSIVTRFNKHFVYVHKIRKVLYFYPYRKSKAYTSSCKREGEEEYYLKTIRPFSYSFPFPELTDMCLIWWKAFCCIFHLRRNDML
jgi:hypothetical protein